MNENYNNNDLNRRGNDNFLGASKDFSWDRFDMDKFFKDTDKVREIVKRKEENEDE